MNKYFIGWPTTASRPCLRDSIKSFADNAVTFGHKPEFIISSDLVHKDNIDFALNISNEVEKKYDIKISLVGKNESSEYIKKIAGEFDPELLAYALMNEKNINQFGHNSNQLILATAGYNYIQTDDDVYTLPANLDDKMIKEFRLFQCVSSGRSFNVLFQRRIIKSN